MTNVCEFTDDETATVLAALRMWQAYLTGDIEVVGDEIKLQCEYIALNGGPTKLSAHEIDILCEEINC